MDTLLHKVIVFTEDTYGEEALRILFSKLYELGIIKVKVHVKVMPGRCNAKLKRVIEASCREYDKVILLIDGDGDPETAKRREEEHLPREGNLRDKVEVIPNKYELEEWILHARYNEKPGGRKPSERLKELTSGKYQKKFLPKHIKEIIDHNETLHKLISYPVVKKLIESISSI